MKTLHRLDHTEFLVPPGKKILLKNYDPDFSAGFKDKDDAYQRMLEDITGLAAMQDLLWASSEYAVVIIFQAMDAAGKDGTIKHVMSGVNPQGVEVHSFKAPTEEELRRNFLWRPARAEPARGRIAIFNRSYYEEVLVVRVHPDFLHKQRLPRDLTGQDLEKVWQARYDEINAFEKAWHNHNICVIKFFLHLSKKEQKKRFLERLDNPQKNWKFSSADLRERGHWEEYMRAYEDMLGATSTEHAPWYVIPADKKWFTRACVADIITARIEELKLNYPMVGEQEKAALKEAKKKLKEE